MEFETFFHTDGDWAAPGDEIYFDSTFEKRNAFTLRNLQTLDSNPNVDTQARQCHDYLKTFMTYEPFDLYGVTLLNPDAWPPVDHVGD